MATQCATGTITISTGGVGTTLPLTGLPFQPVAIFFFWSGRATNGQGEADSKFGAGFAVSTSSRRAYATQDDHGLASMATDNMWRDDACVCMLTTAGAVDGLADLSAIAADGFTLIIDDVFSAALQVGWIAWGGSDISSAVITDFSEPGATGNQDINTGQALNTGLNDKAVIILGGPDVAVNTGSVYSMFSFGVAAGDTIAQAVLHGASTDGPTTSMTHSYCRAGEVAAVGYDDLMRARVSVTTWLSNGFRLNWAEVDAGVVARFSALSILGGRWMVGDALTSTGTSNQTEATALQPTGLLIGSHGKAQSTADTVQADMELIIGVANSASSRRAAGVIAKDAQGTADIGIAFNETAMYVNQSNAATVVVEGLMDLVSFDATPGFTYVMDDADPVAAFFFYLACADTPAAGTFAPPPAFPYLRHAMNSGL